MRRRSRTISIRSYILSIIYYLSRRKAALLVTRRGVVYISACGRNRSGAGEGGGARQPTGLSGLLWFESPPETKGSSAPEGD